MWLLLVSDIGPIQEDHKSQVILQGLAVRMTKLIGMNEHLPWKGDVQVGSLLMTEKGGELHLGIGIETIELHPWKGNVLVLRLILIKVVKC